MSNSLDKKYTVAVVGGGLVGCLQACYMAKRGYHVNLYDKRGDIRKMEHVPGRSVNLAMSERAIQALAEVGLADTILAKAIPMKARMIHELDGRRWAYPYGTHGEHINSIDRRILNEVLLTETEKYPNVTVFFEHKLKTCHFDKREMVFIHEKKDIRHTADLIFGCDGAYSNIRQEMIKTTRTDFSQTYIPHGYVEICMPAKKTEDGDDFAMEENYLHIWPRDEFMMIGLPNLDKSFTGTLFMPFDHFGQLKTREDTLQFFREKFPDSIDLFGEENLMSTYEQWSAQGMISVKCNPFHYEDKCVLMGDAAHAIVPFYGQGMNSGMEDCLVLKEAMDKYPNDIKAALDEYSRNRTVDAHAICDLAMYNYVEMRSKVNSKMFLMRRKVDKLLHWFMPSIWIPLYTTVSFTRIPYQKCIDNKAWQDKMVARMLHVGLIGGVALSLFCIYKNAGNRLPMRLPLNWR